MTGIDHRIAPRKCEPRIEMQSNTACNRHKYETNAIEPKNDKRGSSPNKVLQVDTRWPAHVHRKQQERGPFDDNDDNAPRNFIDAVRERDQHRNANQSDVQPDNRFELLIINVAVLDCISGGRECDQIGNRVHNHQSSADINWIAMCSELQ